MPPIRNLRIDDPKSVSMCTKCRRMIQTREMKMGEIDGRPTLLCRECYMYNPSRLDRLTQKSDTQDKIDPKMEDLQKYLEDKELI